MKTTKRISTNNIANGMVAAWPMASGLTMAGKEQCFVGVIVCT
jgi:hypothetical protein